MVLSQPNLLYPTLHFEIENEEIDEEIDKTAIKEKEREVDFLENVWAIQEDELLITMREQPPQKPWKAILSAFKSKNRKYPQIFRYERDLYALQERYRVISTLPSFSDRYELLQRCLNLKKEAQSEDPQNVLYEKETETNNDQLRITVEGYGFPSQSFIVPSEPLVQQSHFFSQAVADWVPLTTQQTQHITLSDMSPQYEGSRTFNHFEYTNFVRFLRCCQHPHLHSLRSDGEQKLSELKKLYATLSSEVVSSLNHDMSGRLNVLVEAQVQEERLMDRKINRLFEAEVAAIRARYLRIREMESLQLSQRFDTWRDSIKKFFEGEITTTKTMSERSLLTQCQSLEGALKKLQDQINDIFGEDPVRLCILADDLQAPLVREAAIMEICTKIQQFYYNEALRDNSLLSTQTYKAILSRLKLNDLQYMADLDRPPIARDLVRRELATRRGQATSRYQGLTLDKLRLLMIDRVNEFPDLIEAEIANRRKFFPSLQLQASSNSMMIDNDGFTARIIKPGRYGIARVGVMRSTKDNFKLYWTAKVLQPTFKLDKVSIGIGWDVERNNLDGKEIPGLMEGKIPHSFGCIWQNDGYLHINGKSCLVEQKFESNDSVGCGYDPETRVFSFFLNGKPVLFVDENGSSVSLRIGETDFAIVPCACLYSASSDTSAVVQIDVTEPFDTGTPHGYLAYSDL
eukprot:TRINITY_DN7464_c0_g1_i1.p1 TRINITY_DN7464_c0_g1~~TRINITY_DN7464_c0_g1_i1.p1  ORF type:complete len:687 (-),score=175.64 TRINITY_DN7464_c0_g1_i1:431-2491(-)